MTKTFYEILAEKEDEFVYHIYSTANIHDPEICAKIRISLLPYKIKSMECESYKPLSKNNDMFPNEPNSPTYAIKVITGHPITKGFLSTLAMDAHIHVSHLKIIPESDIDLINKPKEVSSDDAQKLVGTKRLGNFIKELQKERNTRDEMKITREVYECFFTTQRGLEIVVGKPMKKGYYMIEAFIDDGKKYFKAEGPFLTRPDGNPFFDRFKVKNPKIVHESENSRLHSLVVLVESFDQTKK
jgi:predicted metal-binding protein